MAYGFPARVEIEEVSSVLTPAPGVSLEQALLDAQPSGYESMEINDDGTATLMWYRRKR